MKNQACPSIFNLLIIASFASFGAVLLTPALPIIARYFGLSIATTEAVMTYYLAGYAIGQLIYGPLANALGRKNALLWGVFIALVGSVLALLSPLLHSFALLVTGRFLLALGSAAGIVIGMIIIKDTQDETGARQTFAKVLLAFSVVPFLSITLGGNLTEYLGWQSINVVMIIYAILLVLTVLKLKETLSKENRIAISLFGLMKSYKQLWQQFDYVMLITIFSICTIVNYLFNAFAPVVTMKMFSISAATYGWLSLLPSAGYFLGGWISSRYAYQFSAKQMITAGIVIMCMASLVMTLLFETRFMTLWVFYGMEVFISAGAALIIPNASMQALSGVKDHANGTSVMTATGLISSSILVFLLGRLVEHHMVILPLSLFGAALLASVIQFNLIRRARVVKPETL